MKWFVLILLLLRVEYILSQPFLIRTIAGTPNVSGYSGDGGLAINAKFGNTGQIYIHSDGSIYISDPLNYVIRKIDPNGIISTIAGTGQRGFSGDGGDAKLARLDTPAGIVIDKAGNIYFSDLSNNRIRKINTQGIINTIAGTGTAGYKGQNVSALEAELHLPTRIILDDNDNIIFIDFANSVVRKINPAGIISTIAGNGLEGYSGDGGPATTAKLNFPAGIGFDKNKNLYIGDDENYVIRKVDANGIITTFAGIGTKTFSGDGGLASNAGIASTVDITFDNNGSLFFADVENFRIRKIDANGIINTVAGTGAKGYTGDGGIAVNAAISAVSDMYFRANGNLVVSDGDNFVLRELYSCNNTIVPSLTITALSSRNASCIGDTLIFNATVTNAGNNTIYQWFVNGVLQDQNSELFRTWFLKNTDIISCSAINTGSCFDPISAGNRITVSIFDKPIIQLKDRYIIEPGGFVDLKPLISTPVDTARWTPTTGLSTSSMVNTTASPESTINYNLAITDINGCKSSADVLVVVYRKLYMPNAFTPNNDGKNDKFMIPAGTTMRLKSLAVYNRFGEKIFATSNVNHGWDGTFKSFPSPAGVYVYQVKGTDEIAGEINIKGTFLLIR
jgi:gliding motility-associated-like protein